MANPSDLCEICAFMRAEHRIYGPDKKRPPILLCKECSREAEALAKKFARRDKGKGKQGGAA